MTATPTKATSAATAQYLRWRRRALCLRLLDQRLDEGLDLLAVERARLGRGGRGGAVTVMPASSSLIELVLLAH